MAVQNPPIQLPVPAPSSKPQAGLGSRLLLVEAFEAIVLVLLVGAVAFFGINLNKTTSDLHKTQSQLNATNSQLSTTKAALATETARLTTEKQVTAYAATVLNGYIAIGAAQGKFEDDATNKKGDAALSADLAAWNQATTNVENQVKSVPVPPQLATVDSEIRAALGMLSQALAKGQDATARHDENASYDAGVLVQQAIEQEYKTQQDLAQVLSASTSH